MNTGIQDACNLAWKLALVVHGKAPVGLLDTYSPERSPVAETVLKATGRITSVATIKNKVGQFLRNHTASLVLGMAPARQFASRLAAELSVGYPAQPPQQPTARGHGPHPGERAPIRPQEPAVGAGESPRFAIFGDGGDLPPELHSRFGDLLESSLREPFAPEGLWVVRPDGYVALSAPSGDWPAVTAYFDGLVTKGSVA